MIFRHILFFLLVAGMVFIMLTVGSHFVENHFMRKTDRTIQLPGQDSETAPSSQPEITAPHLLASGIHKNYYENGLLREIFAVQDGKLDGIHNIFTNDGSPLREETFKDGKLHGVRRSYRKGGILRKEFYYKDGRKEGEGRAYYADKKIAAAESYRNGVLHGLRTSYYSKGNRRSQTLFEKGSSVSRKKYYPNGLLWIHESFDHGQDEKTARFYYETGEILAQVTYRGGRPVMLKRYSREGELTLETDQPKEISELEDFFGIIFDKTASAQLNPSR